MQDFHQLAASYIGNEGMNPMPTCTKVHSLIGGDGHPARTPASLQWLSETLRFEGYLSNIHSLQLGVNRSLEPNTNRLIPKIPI